jgi:hypothetical protein
VALAAALLAGPAPSAGSAREDCLALHWNLVTLLEEATAAMFAAARVALEAEGIAPERAEAVVRRMREPDASLAGSPYRADFEARFAAFERAQAELLRAAGCGEAGGKREGGAGGGLPDPAASSDDPTLVP